jgi:hypothetical protein
MAHDRRRPERRQTGPATARAVFVIAFLNVAVVIGAGWTTDHRAWLAVLGIFLVSAACVAALVASHHRRR